MSALAAHPSSGPTSSPFPYHIAKDAPLVREMLASPLQWGPGVSKTTFAPSVGVREIMPGPPSPPAGLLQLQPVQPASSSRPVSNGAKVNGTVNGGGHANGAGLTRRIRIKRMRPRRNRYRSRRSSKKPFSSMRTVIKRYRTTKPRWRWRRTRRRSRRRR